jgi:uncharacterized protein YndB with AHSA1/START domain
MDYGDAFGAEFREVQDRTRAGQPVRAVIATRLYATDRGDLWKALTDAERLPRWFAPVTGQLELGGRYQLEGNAGGSILKCVPSEELEITWEFGGQVSWVRVSLTQEAGGTRMTLEHLIPKDEAAEAHWAHLTIHGILHLLGHDHQLEEEASEMESIESKILKSLGFPDPYCY